MYHAASQPVFIDIPDKYKVINKQRTVNIDNPCYITDPPTHGSLFISDNPLINPAIHILRQRYGLEPVFTCQRMYWGVPSVDVNRIFAVTTLELG